MTYLRAPRKASVIGISKLNSLLQTFSLSFHMEDSYV
jgi:hypothetical protein